MVMAGLFPIGLLGELVSIGTLLAFAIVCAGVFVLRFTDPQIHRLSACRPSGSSAPGRLLLRLPDVRVAARHLGPVAGVDGGRIPHLLRLWPTSFPPGQPRSGQMTSASDRADRPAGPSVMDRWPHPRAPANGRRSGIGSGRRSGILPTAEGGRSRPRRRIPRSVPPARRVALLSGTTRSSQFIMQLIHKL